MDKSLVIAIISAAVSLIIATLGYVWTRRREREADWRKKKLEVYHQFFDALSGVAGDKINPEKRQVFAKACNIIGLIASPEVITSLQIFRESTHPDTMYDHDECLSNLIKAIRNDLGLPLPKSGDFRYSLMSEKL